jgi:hypothetical protein
LPFVDHLLCLFNFVVQPSPCLFHASSALLQTYFWAILCPIRSVLRISGGAASVGNVS